MAGGGGGDEYDVNINLTALLDVLTNLLFFLMLSMVSSESTLEVNGNLTLPSSSAELPPKIAIKVAIARDQLMVEDQKIGPIKGGVFTGADPNRSIQPLLQRLTQLKQKTGVTADSADVLFVICDKDTPYRLLHQVLKTGAQAGFPKYRLAVLTH